jgi:Bacterial HORMA domain family 1
MSYNTTTSTSTYTVVDIRKTFEGFEADLRMIARRTEKWGTDYVDKVFHDIIKLAEAKYIRTVDIVLLNTVNTPIRAAKYTVNDAGTSITGDRAGGNDWTNMPNTYLEVIVCYTAAWHLLSQQQKEVFQQTNNFKIGWSASSIDNSFPNLSKQTAQTFASNGYELNKSNYK